MISPEVTSWTAILVVGAALIGVFLLLSYGVIGFFVLFLLLAMAGGALLYWWDGEG
jgi:hypothetical protein